MACKQVSSRTWQEIALDVQKYRDKTIDEVSPPISDVPTHLPLNVTNVPKDLLTSTEISITETPPEELLIAIEKRQYSCKEVTNAFLRRAGLAQKLVNCITELLPKQALARAEELDRYLVDNGKPIGPLHGLPISAKEHIGVKGLSAHGAFVSWADRVNEDDAHVLKILHEAGCVVFARTTEPQSLMHLETASNLYGVTLNPFNTALTPGGSSGGEGALLGLRGTCLGLGTDIGGSIRSPAANNGVWTLRPSTCRIPVSGVAVPMKGMEQILPILGPLSTSLEGIKLFMKTVIAARPWLEDQDGRTRLKIGVLWSDGVVKPQPPTTRALKEVTGSLKAVDEVELVEWLPWKHDYAWDVTTALYFCDGGKDEKEIIDASGEPWLPLSNFIIKEQPHVEYRDVDSIWKWTAEREKYRAEYNKLWNEREVDVILCPAGPGPAPPLNCSRYWGYTSQWNLLDYPALVFPVGQVDPGVDVQEKNFVALNDKDQYNHDLYEPEKFRDAPISLQLVGRRYEDEKVCRPKQHLDASIQSQPSLTSNDIGDSSDGVSSKAYQLAI
ncbi:MAG: hypothetical protein Q9157_003307 [Trypethelium eluteriae]